jgi:iron complex transport system substrate-binding protein
VGRGTLAPNPRRRVLALEWLDPPYIGGHWVPEMISAAGGQDPLGVAGGQSRTAEWNELRAAAADVVVVMPCGLNANEAADQALTRGGDLCSLGAGRIYAVDAASSFSRPGPRLADGVELLGHLLHPELVPAPHGLAWHELDLERSPA